MQSRIVIKVGSLAVTDEAGGIAPHKVEQIVSELIKLKKMGIDPILVSSGAINTGRLFVKKPEEKKMMISYQQASAAVGQPLLMMSYIETLKQHGLRCGQILVTHEDFKNHKNNNYIQYYLDLNNHCLI
jgi:glutamate 5-kinase